MSAEANKETFRRFISEVLSQGRLDVVDEIFSPDFDFPGGISAYKQIIHDFRAAFPDLQVEIEKEEFLIGERDLTADRLVNRGTHQGQFRDIPPTGVKAVWNANGFCRFKDGKIAERRQCIDIEGLLRQLRKEQ